MIHCIKFYLNNGLIEDKTNNLELKKLIQYISQDIFEWFEENEYLPLTDYYRHGTTARDYYNLCLESFKNVRSVTNDLSQPKFTRYFNRYCSYKGWEFSAPKGNGKNYNVNKK